MDFVSFALQGLKIHSFMIQIRILSMIIQTFSTTLHSPSTRHTHVATVSIHPEPSRRFNFIYDDDDDDEERTIPLNEIISQLPSSIAITPVLPTKEPKDSLVMGDEDLSTIPKKESDEFIKSSVEDLVPILSESEDTFDSDSECDLPFCDNSVTFSNPLFDAMYNIPLDSYVSNFDEPALLVTPLSDANEDKCFDPGGDIDEIDAFLDTDVSTDVENGYHDSEGDLIYLESLLIKDTILNLPSEVFLDRDPRSLEDEPDKDDLKNIDCPDYEDSRARGLVHVHRVSIH
ncbi:hypothetical protein Tco_1400317 [Tanacetum coccineum]